MADEYFDPYVYFFQLMIKLLDQLKFEFQYDNNISNIKYYLIDVIKNREVSNEIASVYNINHESPQLIVIKNGDHSLSNQVPLKKIIKELNSIVKDII